MVAGAKVWREGDATRGHGRRRLQRKTWAMELSPPELLIVMPVFNEQASVRKAVLEWFEEIENWTEKFVFLAINDGSTDGTARILVRLRDHLGPRFELLDQANCGHGQSCLRGYRVAAERGVPFVFQIDSDGQCDPQYFFKFWRQRETFDVIYGHRTRREDGSRRVVASGVVKLFLLILFRVWCADANVPYRLMRTAAIAPFLPRVQRDFSLANIGLAVWLRKNKAVVRHGAVPIHFRPRYGGEPAVSFGKVGAKAGELFRQLRGMLRGDETVNQNAVRGLAAGNRPDRNGPFPGVAAARPSSNADS